MTQNLIKLGLLKVLQCLGIMPCKNIFIFRTLKWSTNILQLMKFCWNNSLF